MFNFVPLFEINCGIYNIIEINFEKIIQHHNVLEKYQLLQILKIEIMSGT